MTPFPKSLQKIAEMKASVTYTVRCVLSNGLGSTRQFTDHAEARRAYETAIASRAYLQVHIDGPGYGPKIKPNKRPGLAINRQA